MLTKKNSLSLLWLIPFVGFAIGYIFATLFFSSRSVEVPELVGLSLIQGATRASTYQLNIRVIAEKEDRDLPAGTIISQKPLAHQTAKTQQVIYIAISKRPETKKTPALVGISQEQAAQELTQESIKFHLVPINIPTTPNLIIAQYPTAEDPLHEPIVLYCAQPTPTKYIFPDCVNRPLSEVLEFLAHHKLTAAVTYQTPQQPGRVYRVSQQRPLPGTVISPDQTTPAGQSPVVQLLVEEDHNAPIQT